jgi:hypothetical protein
MQLFKKYFRSCFILLLALCYSSASFADRAEYQFGAGLLNFKYTEYLNNAFLDGETGFIPGVLFKRKQNNTRFYSELVAQFYANTINYDGQTQSGVPLKTKSNAIIMDTHFKLGSHYSSERNHGPYLGLGYRYWFRNILPGRDNNGNLVAGVLEEYYWFYGLLGYRGHFAVNEKVKWGFDIRQTQMINAKMDINYLGFKNYDNAQVNLGNRSGLRLAIPIQVKLSRRMLSITPYYEVIDIGRSNSVPITIGGVATGSSVFEPRSETRNVGIEITLNW